jgi:hypothetical protein
MLLPDVTRGLQHALTYFSHHAVKSAHHGANNGLLFQHIKHPPCSSTLSTRRGTARGEWIFSPTCLMKSNSGEIQRCTKL